MSNFSADEHLHAFMDGELEPENEQALFDELASNPELQSEMKDVLAIRNAIQRDTIFPYAANEASILAAAGLTSGTGAAGVTGAGVGASAGAGAAAAASSGWVGKTLLTLGGSAIGAVVMYFFMLSGQADLVNNLNGMGTGVSGPGPTAPAMAQSTLPAPKIDTVYSVRVVRRNVEVPVLVPVNVNADGSLTKVEGPVTLEDVVVNPIYASNSQLKSVGMDIKTLNKSSAISSRNYATYADLVTPKQPVSVRFRTLASGISSSDQTPQSVAEAFLPNTAYGLFLPVGSMQKIGLEMGTESFTQVFSGTVDGRTGEYTQTPVLFWMGATYGYYASNLTILPGLFPFVEATVGAAFSQGPLGRATFGLTYQPIGPLKITAGIDASALGYQYQNQWFGSSKFGMSYGISFDLGALK